MSTTIEEKSEAFEASCDEDFHWKEDSGLSGWKRGTKARHLNRKVRRGGSNRNSRVPQSATASQNLPRKSRSSRSGTTHAAYRDWRYDQECGGDGEEERRQEKWRQQEARMERLVEKRQQQQQQEREARMERLAEVSSEQPWEWLAWRGDEQARAERLAEELVIEEQRWEEQLRLKQMRRRRLLMWAAGMKAEVLAAERAEKKAKAAAEKAAAEKEAAEKEAAEKAWLRETRAMAATRLPPRLCFFDDTPVFQPRLSWVEAERRRVEAEEAKAGTAKLRQLELDELGELVEELKSEQTLTKKELMQRINERGAVATRSQIEKVLAGAWYKAPNCVICLERTVQTDRRMYELCSHWVCSGCRRKQASMPGVLRCPLCRTVHPRSPEEQRAVQIQRERFMVPSESDSDSSSDDSDRLDFRRPSYF